VSAPIQYARSGDVHVAYQVVGDGPVDLVMAMGAFTNLEVLWELQEYRRLCENLGSFARLLLFDKRGMGLSDRVHFGTLEERMDDIRAVMDAAGSESAALIGVSEGGPLSVLFAATYPERTRALILAGAEVKEEKADDWPWGEATREEMNEFLQPEAIVSRWGKGLFLEQFIPSRSGDENLRAMLGRLQVQSASPTDALAFMRMAFEIDVRDIVPSVNVPTLVVHRTGDRVCNIENGRFLARHIPGAKFIELPGADHSIWTEQSDVIVSEIREFLTGVREPEDPDRVVATILFTDIVGSTERARELGDRAWRNLLDEHHALVRHELERFRGREIDTAGDGFFATFDGPARAIRSAKAIGESIRTLGIELRAGLHTGEVELAGDAVRGIAVHTGARVAAHAGAGECWSLRRSRTSSPARASSSRTAGRASSRVFRASGVSTQ
jgi:pimeloyl-ACP methyl ester carboxylesterase